MENGIVPLAIFGQEGWNTAAMYDAIATRYAAGGIKALDTQEASITDEGYVKAANKLEELVKAGLFQTGATTTNYDQASEMFLSGKAAMFLNGQWYIEDATKALGEDVDWMFYPAEDAAAYEAALAEHEEIIQPTHAKITIGVLLVAAVSFALEAVPVAVTAMFLPVFLA